MAWCWTWVDPMAEPTSARGCSSAEMTRIWHRGRGSVRPSLPDGEARLPSESRPSGVGDAAIGRCQRLEALLLDRIAAHRADPVGPFADASERTIDEDELPLEGVGQGQIGSDLARDLAAIGEVIIEVHVDLSAHRELVYATEQMGSFVFEKAALGLGIDAHDRQVTGPLPVRIQASRVRTQP